MNNSPIFGYGSNFPVDDAPIEDEFLLRGNDIYVSNVPVLPLLLPQPKPLPTNDEHSASTDDPGSTADENSDGGIVEADNVTRPPVAIVPVAAILADKPVIHNFAADIDNVEDEAVPADEPANVEVIANEAAA